MKFGRMQEEDGRQGLLVGEIPFQLPKGWGESEQAWMGAYYCLEDLIVGGLGCSLLMASFSLFGPTAMNQGCNCREAGGLEKVGKL